MVDDDDITDESTRRVNEAVRIGAPIDLADWQACRNASLMLEVASRRCTRGDYLRAVAACARAALQARSKPAALERPLAVVESCAAGEASQKDARDAANAAYGFVSRRVAGVDDDVAMAVTEACDLAGGDDFVPYGPDPASKAAWAWACRSTDDRTARDRIYREQQAKLADLVRIVMPSPKGI
jgi:hypothetical protein